MNLGHHLLRAWLLRVYGPSKRTGRPVFAGLRAFVADVNRGRKVADRVSQAAIVYQWLPEAKRPRRPHPRHRPAIERVTGGEVPAWTWEAPVDAVAPSIVPSAAASPESAA